MARIAYQALQERAYDFIRNEITSGKLEYNTIYSESRLAKDMGISRTPMRDAIQRLVQEKLIEIIPNKGFMLHRMTEKDIMEIYEVRSAIEGYCAFKAAQQLESREVQQMLTEMDEAQARMDKFFHAKDHLSFAKEDEIFHLALVEHSENDSFRETFHAIIYQIRKLAEYTLARPGRMEKTLAEHQNILDNIRGGHSKGGYNAILEHMTVPLKLNMESIYQ